MAHTITDPAASAALTGEANGGSAIITSYKTGLTSDKQYNGQPFSQVASLGMCLDGESVTIRFPGSIEGLTPQQVQAAVRTLNFIRVKFTGLSLDVKGDKFNKVTYTGTAERVEVVPAAPIPGKS